MASKRNVDTNLGIMIILMFSALLIILSIFVINIELGLDIMNNVKYFCF